MLKNRIAFIFWLILIVIFMFVIFHSSNMPYQQQNIQPFLREHLTLSKDSLPHITFRYDQSLVTSEMPYDFIEFWIRKLGHITEYAVLSFLLLSLLLVTGLSRMAVYLIGFLFPLFYSMTDEWHQSFVPDRTGHLIDVYTFDCFGIVLGMIVATVLNTLINRLWINRTSHH